jgi:anaerobic selenocysteine-containing dehydrogenase
VETFAALGRALGLARETWDVTEAGLCRELLEASRARIGDRGLAALEAGEAWKVAPPEGRGTPSGLVELLSERALALGQPALATYVEDDGCGDPGAFALISAPSVHTHNSTFSHSRRHLARRGPARVALHPADAACLGLAEGDRATLWNARASVTLPVELCSDLPRGAVRVDGLPRADDVAEGVGVNALVSPQVSDVGAGNVLYSTRVDVRRGASVQDRSPRAGRG